MVVIEKLSIHSMKMSVSQNGPSIAKVMTKHGLAQVKFPAPSIPIITQKDWLLVSNSQYNNILLATRHSTCFALATETTAVPISICHLRTVTDALQQTTLTQSFVWRMNWSLLICTLYNSPEPQPSNIKNKQNSWAAIVIQINTWVSTPECSIYQNNDHWTKFGAISTHTQSSPIKLSWYPRYKMFSQQCWKIQVFWEVTPFRLSAVRSPTRFLLDCFKREDDGINLTLGRGGDDHSFFST